MAADFYNLYAGLGGGFGGAVYDHTEEFDSYEEAELAARDLAIEAYISYEGRYGLRSYADVFEENHKDDEKEKIYDGCEDCWDEYLEEREGWLSYKAILSSEDEELDEIEEINFE